MLAVDLVVTAGLTAGLTARPSASEDSLVQTEAGIENMGQFWTLLLFPTTSLPCYFDTPDTQFRVHRCCSFPLPKSHKPSETSSGADKPQYPSKAELNKATAIMAHPHIEPSRRGRNILI